MTAKTANHDALAQQLKADARADQTSFSQPLHERTMAAISQATIGNAASPRLRIGWPIALSAAAALAIGITLWQMHPNTSVVHPRVTVNVPAPADLVRSGAESLKMAVAGLPMSPLADIEQDARNFASYIARQLPTADPRSKPKTDQRL